MLQDWGWENHVVRGPRYITAATDDDVLHIGKSAETGAKRLDVRIYGSASTNYFEVDASANTFSLVGGTGTRKLGGLVYKNTAASAAITNVATITNFDTSYQIPASSLTAGTVVKVRLQVIATATNSTDTLIITLRLGTVAVFATAALDATNDDIVVLDVAIIFRTVGASGTFVAAGFVSAQGAAGTATARAWHKASTAIDTTSAAACLVVPAATWSVADAGNSCRVDVMTVEIIQA